MAAPALPDAQSDVVTGEAPPLSPREAHAVVYAAQLREALCSIHGLSAAMVGALDRWSAADLAVLSPAFDLAVRQAGNAAICLGEVGSAEGTA